MDDLISRQAAIDAIEEDADWCKAQGSDWQMERMERDFRILLELPTAQPEIIRCKDCKHQTVFRYTDKRFKDPDRYVYGCDLMSDGCYMDCFDSYCSEAERRTDE